MGPGGRSKSPTTFAPDGLAWVSASYVIPQNTARTSRSWLRRLPHPLPLHPHRHLPLHARWCRRPLPDNSVLAANTAYTFTWVIKNTSTTKWDQSEYDVITSAPPPGTACTQAPMYTTCPPRLNPGKRLPYRGQASPLPQPALIPNPGRLSKGSTSVCPFYVVFQVQ